MQELQLIKAEKFGEVEADIFSNGEEMFMTISQLARCLEYSDKSKVEALLKRNKYLKNKEFSFIQKVPLTAGGTQNTRTFTEDGIYEVTMISEQPKAREFRAWIRGILKSLRKCELKLTTSDNSVSLSPMVIESIMQKYFDNTIKPEIESMYSELINGQKLIYSSIRKALFAPINISAWKNEIY